MRIGPLRQRVTLQTLSESADSYGQLQQSWVSAGEYWAQIRPLAGKEAILAAQLRPDATHAVTLRYGVATITPAMRLLFDSRVFNIVSVLNRDERDRALDLLCTEPKGS